MLPAKVRFLFAIVYLIPVIFFPSQTLRATASPSRQTLPDRVDRQLEETRTLKAYLTLTVTDFRSKSPSQVSAQLAAQKSPWRFYLKAFSPLNPQHLTLLADHGLFWLRIPRLKTIFTGPEHSIAQEDFELKISPQDFQKILFPEPVRQENKKFEIADSPPHWILSCYAPAGQTFFKERELWIERRSLRIEKDVRYSVSGTPYLEIVWSEPGRNKEGREFPTQIIVTKQTLGREIRLSVKDWRINASVPDELFVFSEPAGFKIEKLQD